jgi:hypothetical protein
MSHKPEVVTFKVDEALADLLKNIPNRSSFIRSAVLTALDSACPLCGGSGVLTLKQKEHWNRFTDRTHRLSECEDCHELHLTCLAEHSH